MDSSFTSQTAASVPDLFFRGRFLSDGENERFQADRACYGRVWNFGRVESSAFSFALKARIEGR